MDLKCGSVGKVLRSINSFTVGFRSFRQISASGPRLGILHLGLHISDLPQTLGQRGFETFDLVIVVVNLFLQISHPHSQALIVSRDQVEVALVGAQLLGQQRGGRGGHRGWVTRLPQARAGPRGRAAAGGRGEAL